MLKLCRKIGREARKIVLKPGGKEKFGINSLGDRSLRADLEIEDMVAKRVRDIASVLVSEEKGEIEGNGNDIVVCDPLDGSNNYFNNVPLYGIVLCFSKSRRYEDIYFGYVMNLVNGDEYYADKSGAFFNGAPIRASAKTELARAKVGIDQNNDPAGWPRYRKLLGSIKDVRRTGADALDICYVASGAWEAFVDFRNRLSVVHIGSVYIAQQAGAAITDRAGKKISPELKKEEKISFLASGNKELHKQILELVE